MASAARLQTVRYGGEDARLLSMLSSVAASYLVAAKVALVSSLTVALGDCGDQSGPGAVLGGDFLSRAEEVLGAAGVGFEHHVFGANLGHGGGQNRLAGIARTKERAVSPEWDVLVMANPDTYVAPGCLSSLLQALSDASVGVAEARQIPLEHPKPFDLASGETPWASGSLLGIRGSVFRDLGGFEPAFFLHGDDVDLSWRVRLKGLRVRHVPQAVVFHDKRLTPSGFPAPPEEEEHQAMLARLLLAHRAGRADVVEWWLEWAALHASSLQQEAVSEFERRRNEGMLPRTYEEALGVGKEEVASVTSFVGGEYAEHRF